MNREIVNFGWKHQRREENLPFWRPKNTHNLVMPHSISVCLTIGCESVSKCETV